MSTKNLKSKTSEKPLGNLWFLVFEHIRNMSTRVRFSKTFWKTVCKLWHICDLMDFITILHIFEMKPTGTSETLAQLRMKRCRDENLTTIFILIALAKYCGRRSVLLTKIWTTLSYLLQMKNSWPLPKFGLIFRRRDRLNFDGWYYFSWWWACDWNWTAIAS